MVRFEVVRSEDIPEPLHGPPCRALVDHTWRLTVEEGRLGLRSGCDECDDAVWSPVGGEDIEMIGVIVGRLRSQVERYPGGDVDHWWEFVPERIEEAPDA